MFDHRNFSVSGLFPGLVTSRSIANLGTFEIEVIIEPVYPGTGGGGYSYTPAGITKDKYKVKIRITRKGKVWEYEKIVGSTTAKVVAKVIGIKVAEPTVHITSKSMVEQTEVKVIANVHSPHTT